LNQRETVDPGTVRYIIPHRARTGTAEFHGRARDDCAGWICYRTGNFAGGNGLAKIRWREYDQPHDEAQRQLLMDVDVSP
jgi:hypothetical protein